MLSFKEVPVKGADDKESKVGEGSSRWYALHCSEEYIGLI